MEENGIHGHASKFPRLGNGRNEPNKIGPRRGNEEEDGDLRRRGGGGGNDDGGSTTNRFNNWNHHSSRIIRVSRASGGKDRHSKVMTSKGSRDRRVRLSVTTAIQFYDLQDRLGYDQPSKAVEWLIKSAADAIAELPSLPETPEQQSHERRGQGFDKDSADAEVEVDGTETNFHHQQNQNQNQNQSQNLSLSKSGCSSTSETSKGSGLSLSRSDIRVNRVKARERARERASKEKEKENESHIAQHQHQHHNVNPISQTASFTELLTGRISSAVPTTTTGPDHQQHNQQQWCPSSPAPMDYFTSGLLGLSSSSRTHHQHQQHSSGFSISQIQLGHSHSLAEAMSVSLPFSSENHSSASDQMHQQFSFIPDHHLMPEPAVVTSSSTSSAHPSGNGYNLDFSISSGLAGFNRGTLQSNSPSFLQRFSPLDGSNVPFFLGASAAPSATPAMENNNHHNLQFSPVFDGGSLQLCYGDGCRHSDQKGKAKN